MQTSLWLCFTVPQLCCCVNSWAVGTDALHFVAVYCEMLKLGFDSFTTVLAIASFIFVFSGFFVLCLVGNRQPLICGCWLGNDEVPDQRVHVPIAQRYSQWNAVDCDM